METVALVLCLVLTMNLPSVTVLGEVAAFNKNNPTSTIPEEVDTTENTTEMALRLVNGENRCVGRVEVFYNGVWGTVCDDSWDMKDSEVVCQQLDCGSALLYHYSASFGQGKGLIFLDNVKCEGDEHFLWDCDHSGLTLNNCGHIEDVGVTCSGSEIKEPPNADCGAVLTNPQGDISLESNVSIASGSCAWYISVPNNNQIHVNFTRFIMKNPLSCNTSSVSIYDGTPRGSPLLGQLCGTTARHFTSTSNSLSIVYSTLQNDSYTKLEFFASYYTVYPNNLNVTLFCYSDYMEASVSLRYLKSLGYSLNTIFLNDPQCQPLIILDWLNFHIPYQGCLTVKEVENDTISYTNTLFTYSAETVVIYRKKLSITLKCRLYENTIVEAVYIADDIREYKKIQHGLYSANLAFFQSQSFTDPINQDPYYVKLNQPLYLQATLEALNPDLVLFVDTCVATPNQFDSRRNGYYIIRNGCSKVPDYKSYDSPSSNTVRFGFNAFSFLKQHSKVYIKCKLVVCKNGSQQSRCNQGCILRRKRAAELYHYEEVNAVVGPMQLLQNK